MLDKTFQPADVEGRIYRMGGVRRLQAGRPGARAREPFSIVIPPPNVTGRLHIGHALNNTLQDILARFERMRGKDVLWQPGTDHAGIATQLIVERQLAERQMSRVGMGREKFLEEVWKWKAESGGAIVEQLQPAGRLRRLDARTLHHGRGAVARRLQSVRRALPPEPDLQGQAAGQLGSAAADGGQRPRSREYRDQGPSLAHQISASKEIAEPTFITVATTRPETMLGDTAVAVHPDDERYKALVGKQGGAAADRAADPDHRRRIFRSRKRHRRGQDHARPRLQRFRDRQAPQAAADQHPQQGRHAERRRCPRPIAALDRATSARKKIVADLEALGLLDKIEPIAHAVPHDEKTKTVVLEPLLTEQWYLNVAAAGRSRRSRRWKTARPNSFPRTGPMSISTGCATSGPGASRASSGGAIRFRSGTTPDGKIFVAETEAEAQREPTSIAAASR